MVGILPSFGPGQAGSLEICFNSITQHRMLKNLSLSYTYMFRRHTSQLLSFPPSLTLSPSYFTIQSHADISLHGSLPSTDTTTE